MAFTQADVDAIKTAIKSGASTVRFASGDSVTYRSVAELQNALALAQRDVNAAAGTVPVRRVKIYAIKDL